jgi:hypothetical protein
MNFALLVIGFFIGYIIKTFLTFKEDYNSTAHFVNKVTFQSLKLLGSVVNRMAYLDQLYLKTMEKLTDKESVKIYRNQLDDEFDIWKKETIKVFQENYPEDYEWQLELNEWKDAMNMLTDIYKEEKHVQK